MFSEPVIGEKFFGREGVLELLNKRVSALKDGYRQNIALTGQSLVGKSSIIHHFLHTICDEGLIPVYVEVVKEPFRSFANKFIATLLYNSLIKLGEEASLELPQLLERAGKALPKTSQAIKQINTFIEKGDLDEAYSNMLGLTSILKEETHIPCMVILDEFDNLEGLGIKNPFLNFGKVIMVQKDTMYVVSSSRDQAIKKILSEKLSLLFGNFEIVKISSFDLGTSNRYISMKLGGFDIDERIRKFLIAFTTGNPFYLDKIASRVREVATHRMSSHIDEDVVGEAILDLVYNSNGVIHQYLLSYILDLLDTKYRENYISILLSIADGQNKHSEILRNVRLKSGEISKGLMRLLELGLISKNGVCYNIEDAMLEFWLKHVYRRRKEILVDGVSNKEKLFRQDVSNFMLGFMEELGKGPVTKISELFNLFSNELVQIDSKRIRLPHFTRVEIRSLQNSLPFILSSFRGKSWVTQILEREAAENDIINYIRNVKELDCKVANKIIIPLAGIDENANLLAKELKISIWDTSVINMLFALYGKKRVVLL